MIEKVKILRKAPLKLYELEAEINELIEQGWQPIGELKIAKVDNFDLIFQQMILEKE